MSENSQNLWIEVNEIKKCVQSLNTTCATIQTTINNLTERMRKIEQVVDEKDRRIDDLNLKLESFRVEWKAHTNFATKTEEKKKWGLEQTIAIIAIVVALATAVLVPLLMSNKKTDDDATPTVNIYGPPGPHQKNRK